MILDYSERNSVAVIKITGKIDAQNSPVLEKEINSALKRGFIRIIADMSSADYISSSGLRVFLSARKKTAALNGSMKLSSLMPFVRNIFTISGFDSLFEIYDDEESAYKSFGILAEKQ
ncbi:MAG: STAS domain-containing protein [Methanomicrobium sp.]|nr:STAS domain-containing protein [Methanomicrobium sp.]